MTKIFFNPFASSNTVKLASDGFYMIFSGKMIFLQLTMDSNLPTLQGSVDSVVKKSISIVQIVIYLFQKQPSLKLQNPDMRVKNVSQYLVLSL